MYTLFPIQIPGVTFSNFQKGSLGLASFTVMAGEVLTYWPTFQLAFREA